MVLTDRSGYGGDAIDPDRHRPDLCNGNRRCAAMQTGDNKAAFRDCSFICVGIFLHPSPEK